MKSILTMVLTLAILAPTAQAQSQKAKVGMGVAAVGAGGTFLKLRQETLYKSKLVREIGDEEMKHLVNKMGDDDKLIIKQRNNERVIFTGKYKKLRVQSANKAVLGEYLGKYKGNQVYSVKSVKRVNNKIKLSALKKASPFTLFLSALTVGGSVYSIFKWNAGKHDAAAGRFNGPREITSQTVELRDSKRLPSGSKSKSQAKKTNKQ